VFDSGVGGLSTFQAVRARLPGAVYHYCSDNLHFPYGLRAEDDVVRCAVATAEAFIAHCQLDMLVVACNTMSTVALPALRARWPEIPVVGVVPAIKPAAAASKTRVIALLATPGTVARRYTDELIAEHAAGCQVVKVGSSVLVELAEAKLRGEAVDPALVAREIAPMFVPGLDAGVLGCTHFPLLLPELMAASPWPIQWHDSAGAIAARVAYLLATREHLPPEAAAPEAWFTMDGPSVTALKPALARLGFAKVGIL
jgi:glutamate racemase